MRTSPSNAIAPVASVLSVVLAGCILPYFERSEDGSGMGGGNAIATTVTSGEGGNPIVTTATTGDGGNSLATTSTGEGGGTTTSATASTSGAGGGDSEMVVIQGGTFTLGDLGTPATVADFELDRTEVTVDAYAACVEAGSCAATQAGGNCNAGVPGRGSHPINCVDWNQATTFCASLQKRLPTEAEWEWAARGQAAATVYPWGNEEPGTRACWNGPGNDLGQGNRTSTCTVGSYPSGDAPGGFKDLAGNVWEWTSSPYQGSNRAIRGGGWLNENAFYFQAANGLGYATTYRDGNLGIRCAR